jgi:O-antigen/teichoic acid export membrane protein
VTEPISLRKTGLVVFAARIASVFTGLVFLVIMTRSLSEQQFGFYEVITDLVTFAAYPAGLIAFWATRDIARGKMFGKTAIAINLLLSALGVAIYFALSYFSASRIPSASLSTLFLAALLVPVAYMNWATNSVVAGHKPVVLGYAVIFSEVAKLAIAYPLLIVFKIGINGVILSVMAANLAQSIATALLAGDALSKPIDFEMGKKWLTHLWLPMLTTLPLFLNVADTYVASLAAGETILVAHYQAAFSVAGLAGYSLYLASAMYPLLLKGGSDEVTSVTLDLTLAFGIPMAVGAAVLATPILRFLNPLYVDASAALAIMAIGALAITVSSVFDQTLLGKDKVDVDESATFGSYLRSSLVFVAKVNIALGAAYLAAVYITIVEGIQLGLSNATTLDIWALSQVGVFSFFVLVKLRRILSLGKLTIPRSVGFYIVGAAIMAGVIYFLEGFIVYKGGTFFLAAEIVAVSGIGIAVYGVFVLAVDRPLRAVAGRMLREYLS